MTMVSGAAPATATRAAPAPGLDLKAALQRMVREGASDLHLKVGRPPTLRLHGDLVALEMPPMRPEELRALAEHLLPPAQLREFVEFRESDFAINVPGIGRFRVNVYQQKGTVAFAMRAIAHAASSVRDLNLPPVIEQIAMRPRGLVLVTGVTGSGKSTAVAAMIQYINERRGANVITIEDPIEFVHPHRNSIITQREVGVDCESWNVALKNTLRQAPDVILIGEVRDRETMEHAVSFAETGHLVMCTLHANSTNQALDRIVNFFPEEKRQQLLMDLSLNLRALVSQRLIPLKDRKGRVPAVEILLNSPLVSDLIFKGEIQEIREVMKRSREQGMQTFDQMLFDLHEKELISYEDALRNADSVNDLRLQIKLNSKLYGGVAAIHKGIEHMGLAG
ncbi:MAG: PilT/PilU family type 4a pilus ATPase [Betaproteobacteria bacterium]